MPGTVDAHHLPGSHLGVENLMAQPAVGMRRPACWSPDCKVRLMAGGQEIVDPQELTEEAERVVALICRNPHATSYLDLILDGRVLPALAAVEDSYARESGSVLGTLPDSGLPSTWQGLEDLTIAHFGLCSEHARRVARAHITTRLYTDLWPGSPLPLAPVFYNAGRVTRTQPWTPWAIAVLLRMWALGTLSVTGFRDSMSLLGAVPGWFPVTEDYILDERTPEFTGDSLRRAVAHLGVQHVASVSEATLRAFYNHEVRKRPKALDADAKAEVGDPILLATTSGVSAQAETQTVLLTVE